jgi:hypothetical protein
MIVLPEMLVVSCSFSIGVGWAIEGLDNAPKDDALSAREVRVVVEGISSSFPKTLVLPIRCAPHPSPRFTPRPIVTHLIMELILNMYA